jgi:hypothetical protein
VVLSSDEVTLVWRDVRLLLVECGVVTLAREEGCARLLGTGA